MRLTPIENPSTAPIPPLRAEIVLAPETVMALAQEIARVIIGFLKILLQEAQASQERSLLTPEEVAKHFQVNRQWVYERTSKNEIPHIKVGKYLRFQREEIDRWAGGMAVPEANQTCGIIPGLQIGSNRIHRKRITSRGRATAENPSPGSINPEGGR
jgi:excisionase family DNA binding protein